MARSSATASSGSSWQPRDADRTRDAVTRIAARWGFANSSRFTAYYRLLPSHILGGG